MASHCARNSLRLSLDTSIINSKDEILLAEKSILEKKIKKIEKKIEKEIEKEEIIETKILKDGDNLSVNWEAKYLTIKIWDSNQEDGDKINLTINSEIILKDFETENKVKQSEVTIVSSLS